MKEKGKGGKSKTHSHKRTGMNVTYKKTRNLSGIEKVVAPKNQKSVTKTKKNTIGSKIKAKKANSNFKSTRSGRRGPKKGY